MKPQLPASGLQPFDIVVWAIPFFIIAIVLEMLWAARHRPDAYEPADTWTSLALGVGSTVIGGVFATTIYAAATWAYAHRVFTVPVAWPIGIASWIGCFLLDDLNYYWFHRSAHRVRWFWAAHVNHHSSQHYNLSTALRQPWTTLPALSFAFRIWPAFIGFPPAMLVTVGGINLVYQFWIHTEAVRRLPRWLEAVLNTPSHHRVHHAVNPRYLDRNYAGVLIVWDRLFGTFAPELDEDPPRYGIIRQLGTFGLLHSAFHEWKALLKDLAKAPFRHKLSYLLRPPGWSHDGSRDSSDAIRERWRQQLDTEA
ncbi:sterol desaturase family protein [Novosphingobium cyanobacteriorum]|uniref:Sterol desaturase family protein n=1 Tax=Novosphingobium cyanobacteriorum TaxID=3024215 RepID=A0ABT6CJ70_9SPHN|nr:sterol desaturase family protein [Novosphingobium cyanobacteriorum]MDF8333608.1 sterol desaturase family protein [Novosphingobium cyanobacteriorum]